MYFNVSRIASLKLVEIQVFLLQKEKRGTWWI